MNKFVVGIMCKESGVVSALSVVDDVVRWKDDVKASLRNSPTCAYALFPENYEFVYQAVGDDWCIGGCLPKKDDDNEGKVD